MYSISARVKVGWVGRVVSSSVVLVAEVFGGVKRHGGEGGKPLTLFMSLPCFVRIVPSTLRPRANGQPAFRRGVGFHMTVTIGIWVWEALFFAQLNDKRA